MKVNFPLARVYLSQVLKSSISVWEITRQQFRSSRRRCLGLAGRSSAARDVLGPIDALERRCYVSPYSAVLHTGLRRRTKRCGACDKR